MSLDNYEKVLIIEVDSLFPYMYTNSQSVCNFLNDVGLFDPSDFMGKLMPLKTNIASVSMHHVGTSTFQTIFSDVLENPLSIIGCRVEFINCWSASEFESEVMRLNLKVVE